MTDHSQPWSRLHTSALRHVATPLPRVAATLRLHGALRYCCPLTGSLVLVTEETTLARLARRHARLRCADCGEMHLLTLQAEAASPASAASAASAASEASAASVASVAIVAATAKP